MKSQNRYMKFSRENGFQTSFFNRLVFSFFIDFKTLQRVFKQRIKHMRLHTF